jgi:hypothetical protein
MPFLHRPGASDWDLGEQGPGATYITFFQVFYIPSYLYTTSRLLATQESRAKASAHTVSNLFDVLPTTTGIKLFSHAQLHRGPKSR